MLSKKACYITTAISLACAFSLWSGEANAISADAKTPVQVEADQVIHDDVNQEILAAGHVELVQGKRILRADRITYSLHKDEVIANGDISLLDKNGDVHFAESLKLTGDLRDGFVRGLRSMLADGSRFTAKEAIRENGNKTTMKHASYTPCKVCEDDSGKPPLWQIKADKVVYDQEKEEISYKNARLEFFGVPIAYTPIFSHPGPNKRQQSGFLRPKAGWTSRIGTFVKSGYYWGIAPDKDFTFYVQPTTREGVLSQAEYRQRFRNGYMSIAGSVAVDSTRIEESGLIEANNNRVSIDAQGAFDLTDTWRAGFDVERASDKEFLRLYNITSKNLLTSQIFAERFSGRDYTRIEAISFQDVRLGDRLTQPEILPWFKHTMYGSPNGLLGGRWMFGLGSVGLYRSGNEQDIFRASSEIGWERQFLTTGGIKTVIETKARTDIYTISDFNTGVGSGNNTELRVYPYLHAKTSYPLTKPLAKSDWIVEPIISATIASNVNNNPNSIPNEDSVDVQLDVSNLFEANRFPGIDRVEDGGHGSLGVKTGLYGYNGWYTEAFLGQSVQFNPENNLLPNGSGLEERYSDVIGQLGLGLGGYLDLDYKIQLDNQGFNARRHELIGSGSYRAFDYNARYVYANSVSGTGFTESREQLQLGVGYEIDKNWRLDTSALVDMGDDPGLRWSSMGLHYADECFSFSMIGRRSLINRASGENETSVLLRLGLKNLGEFSTPKVLIDTTVDKTSE